MEKDLIRNGDLFRNFGRELSEEEIKMMNPLNFAYVGDAVYELAVRSKIISAKLNVNKLHMGSIAYVKAKAQSDILSKIESELNDEEKNIVRRGRNSNIHTKAKNSSIIEYRNATGLEALIGWLFLKKRDSRLLEILELCLNPRQDNCEEDCRPVK